MINEFDRAVLDKSIYHDPYPIYKHLRENSPILWSKEKQAWVITKYKDIENILRRKDVTAKRHSIQNDNLTKEDSIIINDFFDSWLFYKDYHEHTHIKSKTRQIISYYPEEFERKIRNKCKKLIKNLPIQNRNIVTSYCEKIAIFSLCYYFGVPPKYHNSFLIGSKQIINFMQGRYEISDFNNEVIKTKKALSAINKLVENHILKYLKFTNLTIAELKGVLLNMMIDGYEPISNAISNSINLLSARKDVMNKILSKPFLNDSFVYELIRYDAPFQYVVRHATSNFLINNFEIKKYQRILLIIASANFDSDIYPNPENLDFERTIKKTQISFGYGKHYCPGLSIVLPTIKIALLELLKEITPFKVEKSIRYESLGSRALVDLRISKY